MNAHFQIDQKLTGQTMFGDTIPWIPKQTLLNVVYAEPILNDDKEGSNNFF